MRAEMAGFVLHPSDPDLHRADIARKPSQIKTFDASPRSPPCRHNGNPGYYLPHVLRAALDSSLTRSLLSGNAAFDREPGGSSKKLRPAGGSGHVARVDNRRDLDHKEQIASIGGLAAKDQVRSQEIVSLFG